jgi:hypothetical protein
MAQEHEGGSLSIQFLKARTFGWNLSQILDEWRSLNYCHYAGEIVLFPRNIPADQHKVEPASDGGHRKR